LSMPKSAQDSKDRKKFLREMFLNDGLTHFTDTEVLELLMIYGGCSDTENASQKLVEKFRSLNGVLNADFSYLKKFGLKEKNSVLLRMIPEIARKTVLKSETPMRLNSIKNAKAFFEKYLYKLNREELMIVCVNSNMEVIASDTVTSDSLTDVITSSRKVIDLAVKSSGANIFIGHNHPLSSPIPSDNDCYSTDRLYENLKLFDIFLEDHIIVGCNSSLSLREYSERLLFEEYDNSYHYSR